MLTDSLILPAYIEAFRSLKLPLYYCILIPRQCGDIDRKTVFFSEYFKPILASRDKAFNWYFICPVSKKFQMEVNQLPYLYESSDFVAYKFNKRYAYSLLSEPLFGTTNISTPIQNSIQHTSDIEVSPDLENWTVRSNTLLKGNSKYAVLPVDSPEDFSPVPFEMDSLELLKSYFNYNGQLPDSLVLEKSKSDKKLSANDFGYITITKLDCNIFKLVDSLFLIPVSKITGINPINYLETPRYYNFDLGYHYMIRSTVNIHFPWNAELQNIAEYPLIIKNKLGSVKMSIYQKDDNVIQLMIELTLSKIFILSFDHLDIKKFNTDILNVLSRSLVVKRK